MKVHLLQVLLNFISLLNIRATFQCLPIATLYVLDLGADPVLKPCQGKSEQLLSLILLLNAQIWSWVWIVVEVRLR